MHFEKAQSATRPHSKLQILMFGHKYVPSREGGIEIVVDELATHMAACGHDVLLLNRRRKAYPDIREYNGCRVENIFTINKSSFDAIIYAFLSTLKAKKLIRQKKADIIHVHAEGPCAFLSLLGRRRKGYRVVVTIHGLDWQRGKWSGFATAFLRFCERQAVKYADELIVLSKNNQKYFQETYNRKTNYCPNGMNTPVVLSPSLIAHKYGLHKDDYVLFLARIVPEKGLHYLIDAWKQLSQKEKSAKKLVIAGGPSHTDAYYSEICKACEGDDSILMTGFVQGQLLEELFSNAYLYVLPSDVEGMPISLLEALSYGNIALVSDIPENTEVIPENCFVFKAGNPASLRKQLEQLLALDLQTHQAAAQFPSWKDVAEKHLEIYRRLIDQNENTVGE